MQTLGDVREIYRRAGVELSSRVHLIDGRWDAPTPCAGWEVRQLVHHIVEEEVWTPPLFAGQTVADVGSRFDGDLLGDDPVAGLDAAAAAALAAVLTDGALDPAVHLSFGDHPGHEYALRPPTTSSTRGISRGRSAPTTCSTPTPWPLSASGADRWRRATERWA